MTAASLLRARASARSGSAIVEPVLGRLPHRLPRAQTATQAARSSRATRRSAVSIRWASSSRTASSMNGRCASASSAAHQRREHLGAETLHDSAPPFFPGRLPSGHIPGGRHGRRSDPVGARSSAGGPDADDRRPRAQGGRPLPGRVCRARGGRRALSHPAGAAGLGGEGRARHAVVEPGARRRQQGLHHPQRLLRRRPPRIGRAADREGARGARAHVRRRRCSPSTTGRRSCPDGGPQ